LESFLAARQGNASISNDNFAHLYQKISREGRESVRAQLKLDDRPLVLLPANVLGDTATLGRTRSLFSVSMADWIIHVIQFFMDHPEAQLVIRLHPAETKLKGPSVAETITRAFPNLPEHIHLIGAKEKINTYDLIEITDLALVYTTSVGLEMATRGLPVMLSGCAHYRKKGFSIDADSWQEYFQKLEAALADLPAQRLTPEQVKMAWNYAYFYFHDYPRPFPWHIEEFWKAYDQRPLSHVLSPDGRANYERSFQELAGAPMK
jgi:capsule polysaccharide export protein KpsC/LpsZ